MGQLYIKCKEGVDKGTKESKPTIVVRNDVCFLITFVLNIRVGMKSLYEEGFFFLLLTFVSVPFGVLDVRVKV
jgi:hypothetical protein